MFTDDERTMLLRMIQNYMMMYDGLLREGIDEATAKRLRADREVLVKAQAKILIEQRTLKCVQ